MLFAPRPLPPLRTGPFLLEGRENHAVLLLHGLGGGPFELSPLAERLNEQGATCLGVRYPGHEGAGARMPASRWQQWHEEALSGYLSLSARFGSVSVVGFSTGCQLALHLAASWPVARLCLLSPFVRVRHHWWYGLRPEAYLGSLGRLIDEVPRRPLRLSDPQARRALQIAARYRTFHLGAVRSALELIARVRDELPLVTSPTLIVQSRADSVVDPDGALELDRSLGSARERRLVWLEKSEHAVALDLERERVWAEVERFVQPPGQPAEASGPSTDDSSSC